MKRNILFKLFYSLLVFIMTSGSAPAQQYWIQQQCPTTKSLQRLTFADTLNGWAVGDSGAIVHTSNGGINWDVQQSSIITPIEDLFFINNKTGFAISNDYSDSGTIILKTSNGGINWSNSRYPDTTLIIRSVYFLDSLTGFFGGITLTDPVILRTTNGGTSWVRANIRLAVCYDYPVLKFNFPNTLNGYACGGFFDRAGICWQTSDGGLNWTDTCISAEPLFDIYTVSENKILIAGGDLEYGSNIYSSSNAGSSWKGVFMNVPGIAQRIAARTPAELWIPCGILGKFAVTLDTARNWLSIDAPEHISVFDTRFINPYSGWSVGNRNDSYSGVILKYNSAVIGILNEQTSIPDKPMLYQNYPNPFNPVTEINFSLVKNGHVKLVVYDMLGRIVANLVNETRQAGAYTEKFDGANLASGIYIYKIETAGFEQSKKMVLIK